MTDRPSLSLRAATDPRVEWAMTGDDVGENVDLSLFNADAKQTGHALNSRPLIIVLITIQRLQHKSCVYCHSTSSTQVARVLHHNFFLRSIVACVYTVTIPLASAALSHVLFRSSSFNVFNTSRVCIPLRLSSSKNCCLCLHSNYPP